ncbi:MAG: hypothetical protein RBT62_05675 [Spirochaetia bacterium]|nr:hypothetical protein [Spirochaetia bacterium]
MIRTKASLPLLFSVVFMDMVGFGFKIPLIPDYIKRFGGTPAFVAAGIAALNLLLITFILPESLSGERRDEIARNPRRAFTGRLLLETLRRRGTGTVLQMSMLYPFGFTLFQSMFALFAAESLGVGPAERGW